MRARVFTVTVLAATLTMTSQAQQASDPVELPTRRVVLYKSGVGYFEHIGNVTGTREVAVQFTSTQLDDVLKSLMALDLDNGTISAINYNSVAPIEQRLRALRMPTGSGAEANAFYNALRGARIDVTAPTGSISGRLLSVERRPRVRGDMEDEVDTLTVVSDAGLRRRAQGGGSADGSDGIVPAPPVVGQAARAASMTAAASAQDLGDLFEYRVDAPITIRKDQSALVPIVNAPMEAERVSVWSSNTGSSRPLRALWITNTTGLTLDGGTFSVVDARAFAGEGLIDSLKPGERRLVSFGTDLAVRVDRNPGSDSGHYARVVARGGVVTSRREDRAQWVRTAWSRCAPG